jgi:hypothetical protein
MRFRIVLSNALCSSKRAREVLAAAAARLMKTGSSTQRTSEQKYFKSKTEQRFGSSLQDNKPAAV